MRRSLEHRLQCNNLFAHIRSDHGVQARCAYVGVQLFPVTASGSHDEWHSVPDIHLCVHVYGRGVGKVDRHEASARVLLLELRKRGVDLMSHMSGVTSMAHTEADVDETLQAFEDTVQEMIADGHIGGRSSN